MVLSFVLSSVGVQAQTLQEPADVRNVQAVGLDGAVRLTWDAASDDGLVTSYKVYYGVTSVQNEGENYDQEIDITSSDTSYEVTNLINDDTYFFAVTAVDDQGLESLNYSVETFATPTSGKAGAAPFLVSAAHTAPNKILVVMSEPIQIDDPVEAFELTEDFSGEPVSVLNTLVNSQQATLIVDASSMLPSNTYRVTATTGVTDFDGNPVSSGVVDSVEFTAQSDFTSDEPDPPAEEPEVAVPEELIDEPVEEEEIIDDESAQEPDDLSSFFLDNTKNSDTADFLDSLLNPENPINNLDGQTEASLTTEIPAVEDPNPIDNSETEDLSSAPDQIPPQDARSLAADTSNMDSGKVAVSWQPALDIDGDVKDQILYMRVGLGAWDEGVSLGKDLSQTMIAVVPNQNYQIRLVTVDNAGNESFGAAFNFSTTLSQSGGGQGTVIVLSVLAVLGFLFLFAGGRRT